MQIKLPVYVFDDKYSAEIDGFTFDLSAFVGDEDELLDNPTATIRPATATIESIVNTATLVTVWISGGTNGVVYTLELRARTKLGRDTRVRSTFRVEL